MTVIDSAKVSDIKRYIFSYIYLANVGIKVISLT